MEGEFHLILGHTLQGETKITRRTLILVFQVNCPGCFHYAIPTAEAVYQKRNRLGLGVLGVSTAFEDFSLNTVANTRALLEDGTLVGAAAASLGSSTYEPCVSFPVATDAGMEVGVGETFSTNRLPGTPTWALVDPGGGLLGQSFGRLAIPGLAL